MANTVERHQHERTSENLRQSYDLDVLRLEDYLSRPALKVGHLRGLMDRSLNVALLSSRLDPNGNALEVKRWLGVYGRAICAVAHAQVLLRVGDDTELNWVLDKRTGRQIRLPIRRFTSFAPIFTPKVINAWACLRLAGDHEASQWLAEVAPAMYAVDPDAVDPQHRLFCEALTGLSRTLDISSTLDALCGEASWKFSHPGRAGFERALIDVVAAVESGTDIATCSVRALEHWRKFWESSDRNSAAGWVCLPLMGLWCEAQARRGELPNVESDYMPKTWF